MTSIAPEKAFLRLWLQFPADFFFVELYETSLFIRGHCGRMVQSARVKPEAFWIASPHVVDSPLEKPCSQSLADVVRHQTELHQFNLIGSTTVELGKASRRSIDVQDMHFIQRVTKDSGQFVVGEFSAAKPVVVLTHGVVEKPVVRYGRRSNVNNSQSISRCWYGSLRRNEHFQIVDGDINLFHEFILRLEFDRLLSRRILESSTSVRMATR